MNNEYPDEFHGGFGSFYWEATLMMYIIFRESSSL